MTGSSLSERLETANAVTGLSGSHVAAINQQIDSSPWKLFVIVLFIYPHELNLFTVISLLPLLSKTERAILTISKHSICTRRYKLDRDDADEGKWKKSGRMSGSSCASQMRGWFLLLLSGRIGCSALITISWFRTYSFQF